MTRAEEQALLQQLKSDYRHILINYFTTTDKTLKDYIDKFINAVFYANIPVPRVIEIHMELIDEFSKQLKLEGRSDEALLDYRITLIDILAHLCELYRCSISQLKPQLKLGGNPKSYKCSSPIVNIVKRWDFRLTGNIKDHKFFKMVLDQNYIPT